jgi:FlaA1/EpsC-like NDP-sugar epimerase
MNRSSLESIRRMVSAMALDALLILLSLLIASWARSLVAVFSVHGAPAFALLAIVVGCGVNYLFGLYHRLWDYASGDEVTVIAGAVATSTLLLTVVDLLWSGPHPAPLSVVWMAGMFNLVGFVGVRYRAQVGSGIRRRWRTLQGQRSAVSTRVLIVGAGEAGQLLAWRFLTQHAGEGYEVVGFIDDDPLKRGMRIHGLPVLGDRGAIPVVVRSQQVALIVIAIYNIDGQNFRSVLATCEETPARIKVLPDVFEFILSTDGTSTIRDVQADDLLGRKPVSGNYDACRSLLTGRAVMVTGAAGSIGSELCHQVASFGPRSLIMLDNNETGLHNLAIELGSKVATEVAHYIIGDVVDQAKMQAVFERHRPDIVFHAAAYKHVPLMEAHPDEAVRVNVLGTWVVCNLACRYRAQRFVLISTDKAVNPESVMGATKRLGELMIASLDSDSQTLCTAVRFGNVLGSRGSVVPTFEKQIEMGGPVTITHPEMTRYFMSITEAVSLVIQAATMTEGGDLFTLDMGQQIRIEELARRLIRLRGLRPGIDVPIEYIGIRPGEKLHEQLIAEGEEPQSTHHPHVFRICSSVRVDRRWMDQQIQDLARLAMEQQHGELVRSLRQAALEPQDGQASGGAAEHES